MIGQGVNSSDQSETLACSVLSTNGAHSQSERRSKAHPTQVLKCPRCESPDTKFCYFNNYSLTQPRYFCKNCKRYWTAGGTLRNVPVGGGLRKNKRSKLKAVSGSSVTDQLQHQLEEASKLASTCNVIPVDQSLNKQLHNKPLAHVGSSQHAPNYVADIPNFTYSTPSSDERYSHQGNGLRQFGSKVNSSSASMEVASSSSSLQQVMATSRYGDQVRSVPNAVYNSYSIMPNFQQVFHHYVNAASGGGDQVAGSYNDFCSRSDSTNQPVLLQTGNTTNVSFGNNHDMDLLGAMDRHQAASTAEHLSLQPSTSTNAKRSDVETTMGAGNPYNDWQAISEGLFSGPGADFMYLPGGSWPDLSQFNDHPGPG